MGQTSIEWADHSINPIRARNKETKAVGHFCEKISPGCGHCYSSEMNEHRFGIGLPFLPIHRDKVELFLDWSKLHEVIRRKKPTRYFWCDMTDLFLDQHTDEWIDQCFATMALTPQHTHMVLTKRPERMRTYFASEGEGDGDGLLMRWGAAAGDFLDGSWIWSSENRKHRPAIERFISRSHDYADDDETPAEPLPWPIPSIWLGVSVEDQQRADERIPLLLQTPAAVRFLSCEPLLEELDLRRWLCPERGPRSEREARQHGDVVYDPSDLHWVIVGSESGPKARPCELSWIRSIMHQCRAAKVPVFVKQLGSVWAAEHNRWICSDLLRASMTRSDPKGGNPEAWPESLRVRQFPEAPHV